MPIFCKIGDIKATVTWVWNNELPKKYQTKVIPIEVTVKKLESEIGTWTTRTYDTITLPPGNPFSYQGDDQDSPITVNTRTIASAKDGRVLYSDASFNAGAIQYLGTVFTPNVANKYQIIISNTSGIELFKEEKDTTIPPKYEVACGEECPEGFCKCITPEYPGYCCLDCNSTAASIRAITNDLKGKNG